MDGDNMVRGKERGIVEKGRKPIIKDLGKSVPSESRHRRACL